MVASDSSVRATAVLEREGLQGLLSALNDRGFTVTGPAVRDKAIIYAPLKSVDELPVGWTDRQSPGTYQLEQRKDQALFGYVVGPQSLKQLFHPPKLRLWQAERKGREFELVEDADDAPRLAVFGARSCELYALLVQDRVFLQGPFVDRHYEARRAGTFIVAVNCTQPGGTCFCASMGTGPRATEGFDLALTEILEKGRHCFVAEALTEAGESVLRDVPHSGAGERELKAVDSLLRKAAGRMGRALDTKDLKETLYRNLEHPRWDEVSSRCLSCANCTMVCPTCFCTTVEDATDLAGQHAQRMRRWDSCFTLDFSYVFGGHVRRTSRARYRQWMTHKLATWHDQFGTSGCVGCGRCITWCPVGIDITEEARAICESTH